MGNPNTTATSSMTREQIQPATHSCALTVKDQLTSEHLLATSWYPARYPVRAKVERFTKPQTSKMLRFYLLRHLLLFAVFHTFAEILQFCAHCPGQCNPECNKTPAGGVGVFLFVCSWFFFKELLFSLSRPTG